MTTTPAPLTPELLPCPFCGAKAILWENAVTYGIACSGVPYCINMVAMRQGSMDERKNNLVSAWNNRAQLHARRVDAEALTKAQDPLDFHKWYSDPLSRDITSITSELIRLAQPAPATSAKSEPESAATDSSVSEITGNGYTIKLSPEAWAEFNAILEREPQSHPRMRELLSMPVSAEHVVDVNKMQNLVKEGWGRTVPTPEPIPARTAEEVTRQICKLCGYDFASNIGREVLWHLNQHTATLQAEVERLKRMFEGLNRTYVDTLGRAETAEEQLPAVTAERDALKLEARNALNYLLVYGNRQVPESGYKWLVVTLEAALNKGGAK